MKKLMQYVSPILTGIVFVIIFMVMFTTLSFKNEIDASFVISTLIGTILMIFTTIVWRPVGIEKGKENQDFKNMENSYNKKINYIIDNQLQGKARNFCEYKNENFKEQLLKLKLAKLCLDLTILENYKKFVRKQLKAEENKAFEQEFNSFNKKQKKMLENLTNKELSFNHLKFEDLIKIHKKNKSPKPTNMEKVYNITSWAVKILWAVLCFGIVGFVIISPSTGGVLSKLVQIAFWTLTIATNIFTSIQHGVKSIVEYRQSYISELDILCSEFFEWENIKVEQE